MPCLAKGAPTWAPLFDPLGPGPKDFQASVARTASRVAHCSHRKQKDDDSRTISSARRRLRMRLRAAVDDDDRVSENEEMGNASGLYNLPRNVGGSIGISIGTTFEARHEQLHRNELAGALAPGRPEVHARSRECNNVWERRELLRTRRYIRLMGLSIRNSMA